MHKTIKFALTEAYEKGYEDGLKATTGNEINWEEQNYISLYFFFFYYFCFH